MLKFPVPPDAAVEADVTQAVGLDALEQEGHEPILGQVRDRHWGEVCHVGAVLALPAPERLPQNAVVRAKLSTLIHRSS